MNDERFDETIRRAVQALDAPPPAPREEMWAAIQAARGDDQLRLRRMRHRMRRIHWAVGIAAVLLVGIGLGRWSVQRAAAPAGAPTITPAAPTLAYQLTATQHLTQAEALLTTMRSGSQAAALDAQTVAWATDLLSTTRLLIDSPAATDPKLRGLLQDLELVLAEIAQLPTAATPRDEHEELRLIRRSIEEQNVLSRLRTAIPSGVSGAAS